jgi:hypothetical protein
MIKRLAFPADLSSKAVGMLTVSEIELVSKLGPPHYKSDGGPEYPGPVQAWGIEAEDGFRVILEFHSFKRCALICCDPPDVDRAVEELGLSAGSITWRNAEA